MRRALVAVLLGILALVGATACGGGTSETAIQKAVEHTSSDMKAAVGDNGKSLTLRGLGDSSQVTMTEAARVLVALHMPDAVVDHIDATRALDGIQTDSWDDLTAQWNYHPDDGLTVIIRERES